MSKMNDESVIETMSPSATTTLKANKYSRKGTSGDDVLDFHEYEPVDLADITAQKGLVINAGKGNDTITGSKYNDKITGGSGNNVINLSTSTTFGDDTVVLTKGESLILKLDTNVENCTSEDNGFITTTFVGNDLKITVYDTQGFNGGIHKGNVTGTVTIKNYAKKDVQTNSGSLLITDSDENPDTAYDVRVQHSKVTYMDAGDGHYHKSSFKGTWVNDEVSAENYVAKDKKGNAITTNTDNVKGVTVSLGGSVGYNSAYGSIYADKLTGGKGDDYLTGQKGNDTIKGGTGHNYVTHYYGDGDDTIILTKGEELDLLLPDINSGDLKYEYINKNKDLKISYDIPDGEKGSIILKNFAKKDIAKSVKLYDNMSEEIDLEAKTYITKTDKNFTGTWLNDEIDAREATLTKTIGKGKKKQIVNKVESDKGLTLKGGGGNDTVYGSKYSDTIKGGYGDDTIYGGKGNDKLYGEKGNNTFVFHTNDGVDTIYGGKGVDSIRFADLSDQALLSFEQVLNKKGKPTNDLRIYYGLDKKSYIIVKDYFKKVKGKYTTSVQNIYLGDSDTPISITQAIIDSNDPNQPFKASIYDKSDATSNVIVNDDTSDIDFTKVKYVATGSGDDDLTLDSAQNGLTVFAGEGNNTVSVQNNMNNSIYTGSGNDTITTGNGKDVIDAGAGNNIINTGNGQKTITTGDGNQTITTGDNNDTITVGDGHHNINAGKGSNTITAGDNTSDSERGVIRSGYGDDTITVGDGGYEIHTSGSNTITAGDGDNVIIENPENSYSVGKDVITTGSGDDNIYIKGYGQGTTINAGDGDNTIHYNDYGTNSGINVGSAEITTGSGDDSITIGGYNESTGSWVTGSSSNTVNAGDGDNTVTIGHTSTHDNTVTTGSGDDTISTFGYNNTIKAGDGDNAVTISGSNAYGNNITTGAGDDNITMGSGTNTSNESYWNVIDAGDGHNVITAEGGSFTIKVGDSTVTDNNNENYNIGSEITIGDVGYGTTVTTGTGNDTITLQDYAENIEINSTGGNNTITYADEVIGTVSSNYGVTITTGAGDDTITIGNLDENESYAYSAGGVSENVINAGGGDNDIYISTSHGNKVTTLGGDDTIYIRSGDSNVVNAGEGDNTVIIGKNKDGVDYYSSQSYNSVTTGSGNDEITIVNGYDSIINAGDGNNTIIADGARSIITTGTGIDTITVDGERNKITIGEYDDENEVVTKEGGKNNTVNLGNGSNNEVYIYNTQLENGSVNTITMGDSSSYNTITVLNGHTSITGGDSNSDCTITTGDGDDTITLGSTYHTINAGGGTNNITVGSGNDTITTGSGNDTIVLTGSGYSDNDISVGDGTNSITVAGSVYSSVFESGSGNDTITLGYGSSNEINAGAGANIITQGGGNNNTITTTGSDKQTITVGNVSNSVGDETEISTGSGDDEIKVYGGAQSVKITSTGGNNHIQYGLGSSGSYGWSGDYGTITTGDGNDTIVVGAFDEETGETLVNIKCVTINAGGGANTIQTSDDSDHLMVTTTGNDTQSITVGDSSDYVNITTKGGNDIIKLAETGASDHSVINAGDGNNTITLGARRANEEDDYYYTYQNTITTGSGDDTITIGDNAYGSSEYNANTINAGAGHNVISTGSGSVNITVGNSTVTDENDENYNIGSEISIGSSTGSTGYSNITAGSGNDTITVTGSSHHTTINAGEGNNTIKFDINGTSSGYSTNIITGAGDDNITTGNNSGLSIYAGDGDNTIVAKGSDVTIETGGGKDNITLGNTANELDIEFYGTINVGHAERDVFDHWDEETGDEVTRHEDALEGGMENTVNVNNIRDGEVNIYNSYTDDDKHNTINLNRSYGMEINVTGGHTNIDAGYEEELHDYVFGSGNSITTGAGNDTITNFQSSNYINAGDGNNIITMAESQGSDNHITTGAGTDTITVYGGSTISAGAGNDTVNINVVSEDKYHGDDPSNRGNYTMTVGLGAGNDVINIDENYKGYINITFNYGDGANNVVNGMNAEVGGFNVHVDPTCDCFIRSKQGDPTSMEVVLVRNGEETGDILTIKNVYNEDGTTLAEYIQESYWSYYIGNSYLTSVPNGIINLNKQTVGDIAGTENDDIIYGSNGDDTIMPGYGNDTIRPFGGDDVIDFDGDNKYYYGSKYIHYNIGDGNLTLRNMSSGGYVYLYMEGITDEGTVFEKHGQDLYIVRTSNNETETAILENFYYQEDDPESAGWPNFYDHIYIYEKDGTELGSSNSSLNNYINEYENPQEVHVYPNENNIIVGSAIGINVMHTDSDTLRIEPYQYNNRETIIYGCNTTGVVVDVDLSWCNSNYCIWEREGNDLVINVLQDTGYDPRDPNIAESWQNMNFTPLRIDNFFSEYNTVNNFVFSDGYMDYTDIIAECMTHTVNSTTNSGETLNAPDEPNWWLGNYTFNAGEGNDTINSSGNADIAYGNGGDDTFNTSGEAQSGLFVGGEGANVYNIDTQAYGTHTIVTTSGEDTLNLLDTPDPYQGGFDISNTDNVTLSVQGDDVLISATNTIFGPHEIVIKDALAREIDLAVTDDYGHNTTLKALMEANNIYVTSAETLGNSTLSGTTDNDVLVGLEGISTIKGGKGSDTIIARDNSTVFTYEGDPNNITSVASFKDVGVDTYPSYHPVDNVYLYGRENTVYAQSETNYIYSYNRDTEYDDELDKDIQLNSDHYYAYLDQTTVINDMSGNDTLTLMNTYGTSDGQYMISSTLNTYIVCDIFYYYNRQSYGDNCFDVLILDSENMQRWQNGYDLDDNPTTVAPNYIRIKSNAIESITTTDGYTITSDQLAQLAELTASWLDDNNKYNSFDYMRSNDDYASTMEACMTYVQEQAADMWTQA